MTEFPYLVAVETASIQSYIFNSNRLRENVGASYLVECATDLWAREAVGDAVREAGGTHNLNRDLSFNDRTVEDGASAEVIFAGGGNFVALFRNHNLAYRFTEILSTRVLLNAPGLNIVVAQQEYSLDEALSTAVRSLLSSFKEARSHIPRNNGLLGLGVTATCDSTGLPAVRYREITADEKRYVSAEVNAKLNVFEMADEMLEQDLSLTPAYTYPWDLDNLGRTEGESSYIAVVHADGNGMGQTIRKLGTSFPHPQDNHRYVQTLRGFSEAVKQITMNATARMTALLLDSIRYDKKLNKEVLTDHNGNPVIYLQPSKSGNRIILPFRPLVSGGDDITFVCDGRIGVAMAIAFLQYFEEESQIVLAELKANLSQIISSEIIRDLPNQLTACAGVAIVKAHYPFSRAYDLSEELCKSAKTFKRKNNLAGSALDWHFTQGGLYGDIEDIRKREYLDETHTNIDMPDGSGQRPVKVKWNLTLRPVCLDTSDTFRNWNTIYGVMREFQYIWGAKRSKAKDLQDAIRAGPESVGLFANRFEQRLPQLDGFQDGWMLPTEDDLQKKEEVDCYAGYSDALELMDLFVALTGKETAS